MDLLNFLLFIGLVVAVVRCQSNINQHDLDEYRSAPKRYHRKIRSSTLIPTTDTAGRDESDSFSLLGDEPLSSAATASAPNSSFILDLPYPSHFLFSLQLLNLSLPFIDDGVSVPEDPPTPEFDVNQVINNNQYITTTTEPSLSPNFGRPPFDNFNGGRKVVNRVRNRVPPQYRRPRRSSSPLALTKPFRHFNASDINNSPAHQRRVEFNQKLRATTTPRPHLIKKIQSNLQDRRANYKPLSQRFKAVESTTENPAEADYPTVEHLMSADSSTSAYSDAHGFPTAGKAFELERTALAGFRPSRLGSITTAKSIVDGYPPERFVPLVTTTTADDIELGSRLEFPPPRAIVGTSSQHNKFSSRPSINYLSQLSPETAEDRNHATQIQKPQSVANEDDDTVISEDGATDNLDSANTSTIAPYTDFTFNFTFPAFDFPSGKDGEKPTLPTPLSIDELIRKFTGSDPITDPPTSDIDLPAAELGKASKTQPVVTTIQNLGENLKRLHEVTTLQATPVENKTTTPSSTAVLFPPITTATTTEATKVVKPLERPETGASSDSADTKSAAIVVATEGDQQQSVQRGPLDVSSFDTSSFGAGATPGGLGFGGAGAGAGGLGFGAGGGFQPQQFNFQPQANFGNGGGNSFGGAGFPDASFGGGVTQQNPYFFTAGLYGNQGQSPSGFDGLLHYSPTGPPAGEINAITQGLSLLASYGGSGIGGGQQAFPQQQQFGGGDGGFAQQFGDFNSAALQASNNQIQSVNFPNAQLYGSPQQSFPSFNQIPQQSAQQQFYPQQPFQQGQSFPQQQPFPTQQQPFPPQQQPFPSQQQPQQFQQPFQQQFPQQFAQQFPQQQGGFYPSNQQLGANPQQPQQQHFQSQQSLSQTLPAINPSQFGTLLSAIQSTPLGSGGETSVGTASVSSVTSNTGTSSGGEKPQDASSSKVVEVQLKPSVTEELDSSPSSTIEMISIGLPSSDSIIKPSKIVKKSSHYIKGLYSGYYA